MFIACLERKYQKYNSQSLEMDNLLDYLKIEKTRISSDDKVLYDVKSMFPELLDKI